MTGFKTIQFQNSDLSSRAAASAKRVQVETLIAQGFLVIADFSDVKSISDSYADELFGVLLLKLGEENFFRNIQLRNAPKHLVRNVAEVLYRRTKELKTKPEGSSDNHAVM